jgi:hypothetical protein
MFKYQILFKKILGTNTSDDENRIREQYEEHQYLQDFIKAYADSQNNDWKFNYNVQEELEELKKREIMCNNISKKLKNSENIQLIQILLTEVQQSIKVREKFLSK